MIQKLTLKILNFFDYFHQKKIINFLKKNNIYKFDIFLDIGAHKGESIKLFSRNFIIKKIYSFEASPENYKILSYNIEKIKKDFNDREIIIENYAIGSLNKKMLLNQFIESSSSTLNRINEKSKYFKKKIKFLDNKNNEKLFNKVEVNQIKLKDYMLSRNIEIIDFMKIDTEGYEFEVLLGTDDYLSKIKYILFEHHYDDMIEKNYRYSDIHNLLVKNNFIRIYKSKMPFRKTFEYIYKNKSHVLF